MEDIKSERNIFEDIKIFKDLERDIIETKKCCACGGCVAFCNSQGFDVIKMEGYTPKFISEEKEDNCKECGICYYICPNTTPLMDQLNEMYNAENELGHIITVIAAKTNDENIREFGQDGGIVSTILTYLFEKDEIDGAIVSDYDENLNPLPKIIFDKNDLIKSAGTRYSISPNILSLKDLNIISQDILEKKNIENIDDLRLAFVGTPCQCRAVRKMQYINITPAYSIKFVIGLFCFENFDYDKIYKIIQDETNVKPSDILKMNIKKNFFVTSKKEEVFEINIKTLDPAVRSHCLECNEFTAKFSDISVGASGAPEGHSIIVVRTAKGHKIINSLTTERIIEKYLIPIEKITEWKTKKINWFNKMTSRKTK